MSFILYFVWKFSRSYGIMIIQNIEGEIMEDKLCLIPYSEIEFDKTYTNISEYFLRGNRAVHHFLAHNGAAEKIIVGQCSDFELLSAFMKASEKRTGEISAVQKTFIYWRGRAVDKNSGGLDR